MTQAEICKWILKHKDCGDLHCLGDGYVNDGTPCPLLDGKFHCQVYNTPKQAAQAWLEAHKEQV